MIQVKLQAGIVAGCAEGCEAGSKHMNKCSSAYSFMEGSGFRVLALIRVRHFFCEAWLPDHFHGFGL